MAARWPPKFIQTGLEKRNRERPAELKLHLTQPGPLPLPRRQMRKVVSATESVVETPLITANNRDLPDIDYLPWSDP